MWHFNILKAMRSASGASVKLATILTLPATAAVTSGEKATAFISGFFG
jgi:hypothetical protein